MAFSIHSWHSIQPSAYGGGAAGWGVGVGGWGGGGGGGECFFLGINVKFFWLISPRPPLLKACVCPCSKKVPLRGYKKRFKRVQNNHN